MRNNTTFLAHYGVKGMKWGIRKKRYTKASSRGKIGTKSPAKRAKDRKTLLLKPSEYEHVMHELATWITEEQKSSPVFHKPIGKYIYVFSNNNGKYRIIGKAKIPGTSSKIYERGKRK